MNFGFTLAHVIAPSLSDMEQIRQAETGLQDGIDARAPRSHAQAYTAAYGRGLLFGRAIRREIALSFGEGIRCPACGFTVPGEDKGVCGCTPQGTLMRWGLELLYGPGDPDEDGHIAHPGELRRLCQEGVPVLSLNGDLLNPEILVQ